MIADFVFEITSTTGTGPFTLGGARSANFRTFAQGYSVGDTLPYSVYGGGQFEVGKGTLTSATTLARTEVYNGSAGPGVAVNFAAGNKDISSGVNSGLFQNVVDLPVATAIADADTMMVIQGGVLKKVTAAVQKAYFGTGGGTVVDNPPTLSAISASATGSTTATGSATTNETGGTIYWLFSTSATATAAAVKAGNNKAVTAIGAQTLPGTGLAAATPYYLHVLHRDTANQDSAVLSLGAPFTTQAAGTPAPTVTVNTPASPQMVGTPFPVTGTWTGVQPTALDYQLSDGGGAWVAAVSPTFATTGANTGTYSFSVNPATASAGRTIAVRDHNTTTVVSAASGSYVVNAAAPDYNATIAGGTWPASKAMVATGSEFQTDPGIVIVTLKTTGGAVPANVKFVWSKNPDAPPMAYNDAGPATSQTGALSVHGNAVPAVIRAGSWTTAGETNYGQFKNNGTLFAWGTPSAQAPFPNKGWVLWALTDDGYKAPVKDTSGNVLIWVLT